jgi:asparagine synthase (glutamine-hydrolysing)
VALGNRLLHVTPESLTEELPLKDSDSGCVLTADARIDNREELATKLRIGSLDGLPDSTLILKAYLAWGEDCVDHLVGDFAFAIWDPNQHRLFCARDHMGMKPFYYYQDAHRFLLASDPLAILHVDGVPWKLNETSMADELVGSHGADETSTLFEGIKRLSPAHTLTVTRDGIRQRRYWTPDLSREIRFRRDEEYVEAYLEHMQRAVSDRLRSAYPTAALLSGGLDSPILACMAARQLKAAGRPKLTTLSWVLAKGDDWAKGCERYLVDQILAQEDHIDGQFVESHGQSGVAGNARAQELYGGWPRGGSEHIFDSAERAQAAGARVLIGGFGGDQLPTSQGDGDLEELLTSGRWLTLWKQARARATYKNGSTLRLLRGTLGNTWLSWLADRVRKPQDDPGREMLGDLAVVAPDFAERVGLSERMQSSPRFASRDFRRLRERQWYSLDRLEPQRVAENLGPTFAPFQLDYRLPMFDKRLIEYCLALPPEQHRHGWGRHLIRRAAKGILPESLRVRDDKTGASPPDPFRLLAKDGPNVLARMDLWEDSISQYVDVEKLRKRLTEDMPQAFAEGQTSFPGMGATMRGFTLGEFVMWFQAEAAAHNGANRKHVA